MAAPTFKDIERLWRVLVRGAKRHRGERAELEFVSEVFRLDGVAVQATIRMEIAPVISEGKAAA
jgi:hypothetical protein